MEESEGYKKYEAIRKEKMKAVLSGKDVIHLIYIDGMVPETYLTEFEEKLQNVDFRLSRYDISGDFFNIFQDYTLLTFLVINQATIQGLLNGTITCATWDAIKFLAHRIWKHTRNQKFDRVSSSNQTKEDVTFGLKFILINKQNLTLIYLER